MLLLAACAFLCLNQVVTARMLKSATAREATLSGRCFDLTNETSMNSWQELRDLREKFVKYNTKKSMYRDGDVLAVYDLQDRQKSLAGCANACLLDWRVDNNQTNITIATDAWWNPTDISEPFRECEAFNFNIDTGKCTILSGQTYAGLTSSDNFWSGKLVCDDLTSIQDWAEQVVS